MEIETIGIIRRVEATCACGEEHDIGSICPKCDATVLQVVTMKNVVSVMQGRVTDTAFHVEEQLASTPRYKLPLPLHKRRR